MGHILQKQRLLHCVVQRWLPVADSSLKLVHVLSQVRAPHVRIPLHRMQPGLNVPLRGLERVPHPPDELLPRLELLVSLRWVFVGQVFPQLDSCVLDRH